MLHVPYRGAGPAIADVMGGQVPILIDNLPAVLPAIKAEALCAIIISGDTRLSYMPDVPTFAEVGLAGLNQSAWHGLVAPAGISDQVLRILNAAAIAALSDPDLAKTIRDAGAEPAASTPSEFAKEIKVDFDKMKALVKAARIQSN